MVLKEPVAEVDGQIDLVGLRYVELTVALVLHVDSHELVADLRSVLRVVGQAELFLLHAVAELGLLVKLDSFTFNLLVPAELVQALAEKDGVGQDDLIELLIDSLGYSKQVESKDLVD